MCADSASECWVELKDAPPIQGLRFRRFRGESDFPQIVAVSRGMREADQQEYTISADDLAMQFKMLSRMGFDSQKDVLIAEIAGKVIGWSQVMRAQDQFGKGIYRHFVDVLPDWYGKGIRAVMLRHNEQRLREIAEAYPADIPCAFQSGAADSEKDWISVLTGEGYSAFRYSFKMVRPSLEDIPDFPLPEGVEVRPVKSEHYQAIIDAWNEAIKDMKSLVPLSNEFFQVFQKLPIFDPSIWQIAWHENTVVGTVMNYINEQENKEYNRKRGYVEGISVQRPWRGKGIAKALIARSLKLLKDRGMTEAALGVDAENPSGAVHLYQKTGFKVHKKSATYRKPMN
jgi:GNAT superfamily N-acetyltransferase